MRFKEQLRRITISTSLVILLLSGAAHAADAAKDACAKIKNLAIPASAIGLPTTGAVIHSAKFVTSGSRHYCEVRGGIRPIDPTANDIRFEVNLPTPWNSKALQFGGGAFDGYLRESDGKGRPVVAVTSAPSPLQSGYATFGSDSGHHHHYLLLPDILNSVHASFAKNLEQRNNFAGDALKKMHDVAVELIKSHYGRAPSRMYFAGGSTGGREALRVAQRWPQDYDGVFAAYAAWDQIELDLQYIRISKALYSKGGWLPRSKTKLLQRAVMNACDAQDGLKDGLISDPASCHFDAASLRCPNGATGSKCLSDGQLRTVAIFSTPQVTAFPLEHGVTSMPGFNVLSGADLTNAQGLCKHPFHPPIVLLNSFYYIVADGVLRFFLTNDPKFNALTFDTSTGGKFRDKLLPQSVLMDSSDDDLSAFAHHGGKLLLVHGTADATIPTDSSADYYNRLKSRMGQSELDAFVKLYLIPGFGHGRGTFDAGFDALSALDDWADRGTAPKNLTVVDNNKATRRRSRPLCEYPAWPKYKGSGDVNQASSFQCEGVRNP